MRWAFSAGEEVECPWCRNQVKARITHKKKARKKVPLTVLLCPHCYSVWQWRGKIADQVNCPVCTKTYKPAEGNIPRKGWFLCSCGHTDRIINSIRSLPEDKLLPMRPYAVEGYCSKCAGDTEKEVESPQMTLDGSRSKLKVKSPRFVDRPCLLTKTTGSSLRDSPHLTWPDTRKPVRFGK